MIKFSIVGATLGLVMIFVGSQITGTWDEYYAQKRETLTESWNEPRPGLKECNGSEPNGITYNGRCTWAGQPLD